MPVRTTLALVVSLTGGCFHEPASEIYLAEHTPPQALEVQDPEGASFPLLAVPREPALTLSYAEAVPSDAQAALLLLRGTFEPPLLARFAAARPSSALKQRTTAFRFDQSARTVTLHPLGPLAPGARYTLAWLTGESSLSFPLAVSTDPGVGASLVETWPSRGESHAPAKLARALLRFDGRVQGDLAAHVSLRKADQEAVPAQVTQERCELRGLPAGDCAWLEPSRALEAGAGYQLALAAGLASASGAAIDAVELDFTVAAAEPSEGSGTGFVGTRCALDETSVADVCMRVENSALYVHGNVSESALLTIASVSASAADSSATLSVANTFELRLGLSDGASSAVLSVTDLAAHSRQLPLSFLPAPDLARVSIDEVRADPLGKEPAQEYVELLNFGSTPVSLMGFTLTRDVHARGRSIVGLAGVQADADAATVTLGPGERALVVASDFDPRDQSDGPLPSGVRLLRLDAPLSLANTGDSVFLRDQAGRRVAGARVFPGVIEGQCSARFRSAGDSTVLDLRSDQAAAFELDPLGGCTPGRATFPRP
ncbi:MAG: hypothetical protein JWN04_2752 [Myxococcaceae bacterium]|nr:hypothetical protein [Myxococcaceae bacterium]